MVETFGLEPTMEMDGRTLFSNPNGPMLDLFAPEAAQGMCPWGLNDGVIFGFRVADIEAASTGVAEAGCELLGDVNFVEQLNYSWRHYRGPTGASTGSTSSTEGGCFGRADRI